MSSLMALLVSSEKEVFALKRSRVLIAWFAAQTQSRLSARPLRKIGVYIYLLTTHLFLFHVCRAKSKKKIFF